MSPDHIERRLAGALEETASGLPVPAGRLDSVVAHGARRRRWARAGTAVSSIAAAGILAVASAWAVGTGDPPPAGGVTGETPPEVAVSTTALDTDVVVGTVPDPAITTAPPGDATVGTAPPTTSITGESDETVGTVPDSATTGPPGDATVGTAPPTTSITGESDETVGTVPDSATTTAPAGDTTVGTAPPTTLPAPADELAACPLFGEIIEGWGTGRTGGRLHQGVDVAAPTGDQVVAVASGTVRLRTTALGGNTVYLTAEDGDAYVYSHLDGYAPDVVDGGPIEAGAVVGFVGTTGDARGIPHLHFEIHPDGGAAVDAEPAVRAACR